MAIEWESVLQQLKLPLARPVHPRGVIWVGAGLLLMLVSILAAWHATAFFLSLTVLFYVCFRDPARVPPQAHDIALAPADGIVTKVDRAPWPADMGQEGEAERIVINPRFYDVHVLRAPVAAALTLAQHIAGQWGSDVFTKAAPGNERTVLVAKLGDGRTVGIEVIGGAVPERIRLSARAGDVLNISQPVGYAAFGGEVRLYFSSAAEVIAQVGQRMVAGETPIAALQIASAF